MKSPTKIQGAALIVALFFMSLVAMLSILMIDHLRITTHRLTLINNATRGKYMAVGATAWAIDQLNNDWKNQTKNTVIDRTPIQSPVNVVDQAKITSVIESAEGRFNVNNLISVDAQTSFTHLIQIILPKIDLDHAQEITKAVTDWILPSTGDALLNEYYVKQNPPYRAPHRNMVSISELRLVKGITPEIYTALQPFVIALPEKTKINVNDAEAPVLMTLSRTLTQAAALTLIHDRMQKPFVNTQAFLQLDIVKNNPIPEDAITVVSHYFLVKTTVKIAQQQIQQTTLLKRSIKDNKPFETILWQTKGPL